MLISLIGYMGCGKTHISKLLSEKLNVILFDLDQEISHQNKLSVQEIFEKKGELFFRKTEKENLEILVNRKENAVLSVGGGTPVYYDNMEVLNSKSITIYLRANVSTLSERLKSQKETRPLIARISEEELPEFIAKHLFERNPYYHQAQYIIDTDHKTPEEIIEEILSLLQHH